MLFHKAYITGAIIAAGGFFGTLAEDFSSWEKVGVVTILGLAVVSLWKKGTKQDEAIASLHRSQSEAQQQISARLEHLVGGNAQANQSLADAMASNTAAVDEQTKALNELQVTLKNRPCLAHRNTPNRKTKK